MDRGIRISRFGSDTKSINLIGAWIRDFCTRPENFFQYQSQMWETIPKSTGGVLTMFRVVGSIGNNNVQCGDPSTVHLSSTSISFFLFLAVLTVALVILARSKSLANVNICTSESESSNEKVRVVRGVVLCMDHLPVHSCP